MSDARFASRSVPRSRGPYFVRLDSESCSRFLRRYEESMAGIACASRLTDACDGGAAHFARDLLTRRLEQCALGVARARRSSRALVDLRGDLYAALHAPP